MEDPQCLKLQYTQSNKVDWNTLATLQREERRSEGALVLYIYEVGGAGGTIIDGRGGPSLLSIGLYSTAYFCAPFPPSLFSSRVAGRILT